MSADPRLGPSWEVYLADRVALFARLDRMEQKLDDLSERVVNTRERSAEWSVRAFLVLGAAAASTFFGQYFG